MLKSRYVQLSILAHLFLCGCVTGEEESAPNQPVAAEFQEKSAAKEKSAANASAEESQDQKAKSQSPSPESSEKKSTNNNSPKQATEKNLEESQVEKKGDAPTKPATTVRVGGAPDEPASGPVDRSSSERSGGANLKEQQATKPSDAQKNTQDHSKKEGDATEKPVDTQPVNLAPITLAVQDRLGSRVNARRLSKHQS